jgi:hypothetical protein
MERARYELEEHRLVCVSAVRVFTRLRGRGASMSLRQLAAQFRVGFLLPAVQV